MSGLTNTKNIIVEDIKYKIYKSFQHSSFSNASLDLKDGVSFVGCGIDVGAILGVAHKLGSSVQAKKETDVSPLILFCQTISQANAMFRNFINDKMRFDKLTAEIEKQKIIDKANKPVFVVKDVLTGEVMNQESSLDKQSTMEKGKRLSLNNGIFKPNDNY